MTLPRPLPATVTAQLTAAQEAVRARLPSLVGADPPLGVVLGSGLGDVLDRLADRRELAYADIPHLPRPRASGHGGKLVFGSLGGAPALVLAGRVHLYEGHPVERVVFGARLLARLGCRAVALTNAAGGLRPDLVPGTLLLLRDQLNLTGQNPLAGAVDEDVGPAFVDMTDAYDPALRAAARGAARNAGQAPLPEGVYAGLLGPTYETPAEIRMLATMGADAVGMSTVCETIALRHLGVPVLGISTITNAAAGLPGAILDHGDVKDVAGRAADRAADVLEGVARALAADPDPDR